MDGWFKGGGRGVRVKMGMGNRDWNGNMWKFGIRG